MKKFVIDFSVVSDYVKNIILWKKENKKYYTTKFSNLIKVFCMTLEKTIEINNTKLMSKNKF